MGNASVTLRQLTIERDPVLMQGREGRWRWPWLIAGMAVTGVIVVLMYMAAIEVPASQNMLAWLLSKDTPQFELAPHEPYTFVLWPVVFVPILIAPLLTLWWVHGVSWRRAFSYGRGFDWGQFLRAAMAYLLITGAFLGFSVYWNPRYFQFYLPGLDYIPWFVLALAVIFVQSLSEEVFVKGYLLRVWGAVLPFRLPVTVAVIFLFVLAHIFNAGLRTDTGLKLMYLAFGEVISFAVFFRTQNIAASAGLHWMHNVYVNLLVGTEDSGTEMVLSLYTDLGAPADGSRLLNPYEHLASLLSLILIFALLWWRRSPFCLSKALQPPASGGRAAG